MIFCIMVSFVQTTNLYNGIIRAIVETNYNAPTQIFINQTINSITWEKRDNVKIFRGKNRYENSKNKE